MSEEVTNKTNQMPPSNEEYIQSQNAIIKNRIDKMNAFKEEGIPVYDTGYQPDSHAAELKKLYGDVDAEVLEEAKDVLRRFHDKMQNWLLQSLEEIEGCC